MTRIPATHYAYRFEDRRYSISDEYGEHAYTDYRAALLVYPIVSYTKCGYWIELSYTIWPSIPLMHAKLADIYPRFRRFVNLGANKKFALPTVEAAFESYEARKKRQALIYEARIRGATLHLDAARALLGKVAAAKPVLPVDKNIPLD